MASVQDQDLLDLWLAAERGLSAASVREVLEDLQELRDEAVARANDCLLDG